MTEPNARCTALAIAIAIITGAADVGRAGERCVLPGNVELRVSVADGLGNPVPNERFVRDELILVSGVLSALDVLEAQAAVDRARAQAMRFGNARSPERAKEAGEQLISAQAALVQAHRKTSRSSLKELADGLVLTPSRDDSRQRSEQIEINAVRLEGPGRPERTGPLGDAIAEVRWLVDTTALPSGTFRLQVSPQAQTPGVGTPHVEVRFVVVPSRDATNAERCRAQYVRAQLAFDAGRYEEAANLAGPAAELGAPFGYYRMAALHVLGDAHYATENTGAALDAYRRALEIAKVAFPKSRLPFILGRRIRELEENE